MKLKQNIFTTIYVNMARPVTLFSRNGRGFTLVELLVVISIIGLLASVVLVGLSSARSKSRDAKRLADMNQFAKALEIFFNDYYVYPTGTGAANGATSYTAATPGTGSAVLGAYIMQGVDAKGNTGNLTPTYLTKVPVAPLPFDNLGAVTCTSTNNNYVYETNVTGSTYTVTFCLGGPVGGGSSGGLAAGVHYLTPGGFK